MDELQLRERRRRLRGIFTVLTTLGAATTWRASRTLQLLSRISLANTYGQLTFRWLFAHAKHLERSSRRSNGPRRMLSREYVQNKTCSSEASRGQVIFVSCVKKLSEQ